MLALFAWGVYPQEGPPPSRCPTCASAVIGVRYGLSIGARTGARRVLNLWDGSTYERYTTATEDRAYGG